MPASLFDLIGAASLSRPDFGRRRAQLASSMAVRPPALPACSVLDGSENGVMLVQIGMAGSDVWL